MPNNQTVIAGPCAAESRQQVLTCAKALVKRGIKIIRASLIKPRTKPGFEGVGSLGFQWFADVTKLGITVATEILLPDQVTFIVEGIEKKGGDPKKILFWLGSRNQNHFIQREIAKKLSEETPNNVKLLIKNQPWKDKEHWLGIVEHVLSSGMSSKRIILCHRGFSQNGQNNPFSFRNPPDFEMAMEVKYQTGLPMLLDPSHIGGSVENVFSTVKMASGYGFDGLMVEVHPDPKKAQTDSRQQLTFVEFDRLLKLNA